MIRTMFVGKQAYDKAARDQAIPEAAEHAITTVCRIMDYHVETAPALKHAGFRPGAAPLAPVQQRTGAGFWLEGNERAREALVALTRELAPVIAPLDAAEILLVDHGTVSCGAIPAYLGGISGLLAITATDTEDPSQAI